MWPCRSQDEGAACRPGQHGARRFARRLRKAIADETEKWGKVIRAAEFNWSSAPRWIFHKSRSANPTSCMSHKGQALGVYEIAMR